MFDSDCTYLKPNITVVGQRFFLFHTYFWLITYLLCRGLGVGTQSFLLVSSSSSRGKNLPSEVKSTNPPNISTISGGMPVVTSGTMMPQLMQPVLDENMRHYLVAHHHQPHPQHQPPHHQPMHQPPHHQAPPPHHQPPHLYVSISSFAS